VNSPEASRLPKLGLRHYTVETETPSDVLERAEQEMSRPSVTEEVGGALVVIDQIVNLGEKVWKIVSDNKATANVKESFANAIPQGVENSQALAGFSDLQHQS
jgi:hypothetical protein